MINTSVSSKKQDSLEFGNLGKVEFRDCEFLYLYLFGSWRNIK